MLDEIRAELDPSIQATIDADTGFQSSLEGLSDEEKTQKIEERKSEEFSKELRSWKEKADKGTKAEELANNYKIRAEKAEQALKGKKPEGTTEEQKALSTKDTMALIEAKVSSEDFDEVVEFANYRKIPVSEALKTSTLKAILAEKVEHRATAAATQTKSPRGSTQVSGEAILEAAEKGRLPEKDEDIEKLVDARHNRKLAKKS